MTNIHQAAVRGRQFVKMAALLSVCLPALAHAADLYGVVTNASLGRPAHGARVVVGDGAYQALTEQDGRYRISGMKAGTYTVRVEQPGYEVVTGSVTVSDGQPASLDAQIRLPAAGPAEDILVQGSRASRLLSIERKMSLPTIADVVSADLIGKLPDYNTAEALQRLPGVSVETDQSEPRYVVIRGVDSNFNQVTVDGNLVGIPEAEGRRVALDTIPSDLVAAIEVVKAVTPDYDGNALGGSINIVTPTAFDRNDDFFYATAKTAYGDMADKFGFGGSATYGTKFGSDDQFGVVVAASYLKRYIHSQLVDALGWTQMDEDHLAPTEVVMFDYSIMRERIGAIANFDWRPNDDVRVYVRNIYNEFTDHEGRDQLNWAIARGTTTFPSDTEVRFSRGRATREFRQNNQTQKLYNISPGAELTFGQWGVDLNYTYAHAQEHTPVRDDIEFRSGDVLSSTIDVSGEFPVFVDYNTAVNDPAAFPLRRIRMRSEEIDEDLHTVRADFRYDLDGMDNSFLKFGAKYIDRKKTRDNRQSVYLPTSPVTFADTGGAGADIDGYYDGEYTFGPSMDYDQVMAYFFRDNPSRLSLDAATTAKNDYALDYNIRERIYAGYGMANIQFGELTVIGGARVEKTKGRYNAFAIRDSDGNGTVEESDYTPLSFETSYTNVLPSLHLNYRLQQNLLLRAAWTNTVGRPNYDAQVPTFEEEDGQGSAGNPDLKPYKSMGLDLSLEYYPDAESVLSLAVFYKKIDNPIFTRTLYNTSFAGVALTSLSQPQNANSGEILGIEFNAVRRFDFLPEPLNGFGMSFNATYADSSVDVPGREDDDVPFFRQSKWLVNAALFYEKGPFEARFSINYRDDYLASIGASTLSDVYIKDRFVMDARASYRINDNVEVFGSIANIGSEPSVRSLNAIGKLEAEERYSFTADFGVSVKF